MKIASLIASAALTLTTVVVPSAMAADTQSPDVETKIARAAAATDGNVLLATVREKAHKLAKHTVYRPAGLKRFPKKSLPVLFWGNGGCDVSNLNVAGFLSGIAANGFIVIANGGASALPGQGLSAETASANPSDIIDGIDWLTGTRAAKRQMKNRANLQKIGVMGWSCGGIEALVAGADPRVKAIAGLATGFFADGSLGYDRSNIANIKAPTLIFTGGPKDIAYANGRATYKLLKSPAAYVDYSVVGHSGLFMGWNIKTGWDDPQILVDGFTMVSDWFDFHLRKNRKARKEFVGSACGLCEEEGWKVKTKRLR